MSKPETMSIEAYRKLQKKGKAKGEGKTKKPQSQVADEITQRLEAEYGPVFRLDRSMFGYIWSWREKKVTIALDDWICTSDKGVVVMHDHAGWIDIDFTTQGLQGGRESGTIDEAMKRVAAAVMDQDRQ